MHIGLSQQLFTTQTDEFDAHDLELLMHDSNIEQTIGGAQMLVFLVVSSL